MIENLFARNITAPFEEHLCRVSQDGKAIKYVNVKGLFKNQVYQLCLAAVRNDGYALYDVPYCENYYSLCLAAIQNVSGAIAAVNIQRLTTSEYYNLAIMAVQDNGMLIDSIDNLPADQAENVNIAAVKQNSQALYFVKQKSTKVVLAGVERYLIENNAY